MKSLLFFLICLISLKILPRIEALLLIWRELLVVVWTGPNVCSDIFLLLLLYTVINYLYRLKYISTFRKICLLENLSVGKCSCRKNLRTPPLTPMKLLLLLAIPSCKISIFSYKMRRRGIITGISLVDEKGKDLFPWAATLLNYHGFKPTKNSCKF